MGQYWKILNIDGEEVIQHDGGFKLVEFFWDSDIDEGLINLLLVRPSPVADMANNVWPCSEISKTSNHAPKLLSLANELLLAIFAELNTLQDAICFALAHENLGALAGTRLCQLITAELSPWIGHRLACIGDYTETFPEHLSSYVAEKLALTSKRSFYSYSHTFAKRVVPLAGRMASVVTGVQSIFEHIELSPSEKETFDRFVTTLMNVKDEHPGANDSLVLCNLTTGTYVCGSAVREKFGGRLSLGVLLLSHICWSDDSGGMGWSRHSVYAGRWTGHRFEITTIEKMWPGVEWKDVSEVYVSHLQELWDDKGW